MTEEYDDTETINVPTLKTFTLPPIMSYTSLVGDKKKPRNFTTNTSSKLSRVVSDSQMSYARSNPILTHEILNDEVVRHLKVDFGSLDEFIGYDMGLKKPEELFRGLKASSSKKKLETKVSNPQNNKLLQALRDGMESPDPVQVLLNEDDPKKRSKAAKQLLSTIVVELYGEDINSLEKKYIKKKKQHARDLNIHHELPEGSPVKRILEKYSSRPISGKIDVLQKTLGRLNQQATPAEHAKKKGRRNAYKNPEVGGESANASRRESSVHSGGLFSDSGSQKNVIDLKKQIENYEPAAGETTTKAGKQKHINLNTMDKIEETNPRLIFIDKYMRESMMLVGIKKSMEAELKTCKEVYEQSLTKEVGGPEEQQAIKYNFKMFLNPTNFFIRNCTVRPSIVLYTCMEYRYFNRLQNLDLSGIDMVQDMLCLVLEAVNHFSPNIKTIHLSKNKAGKKLVEILKRILETKELQSLYMSYMEMPTRLFNDICIGLSKNLSLKSADFSHNLIDESGIQVMLLMLQHAKGLEIVDFRDNKLSPRGIEESRQLIQQSSKINKTTIIL